MIRQLFIFLFSTHVATINVSYFYDFTLSTSNVVRTFERSFWRWLTMKMNSISHENILSRIERENGRNNIEEEKKRNIVFVCDINFCPCHSLRSIVRRMEEPLLMYLSWTNRRVRQVVAANIVVIKNIRLTNRTCNYRRRNRVFNGSKRVLRGV